MFKRIGNLIKGFIGLFVGGLEKRSPEALLDVEKENLRKQIAQFNQGLATHAGLVEKLISQVKKLDREENDLRSKTAAHLKAGNRQLAGDFALKLKKVDATHDEVKDQLEEAEKHYKELIRARDVSVKEARDKIQELRRGIDDMKVKKAVAELNEMASGMISEIGGSGDNLNRLEEIVEEERTKAAGRARVAKDSMDLSGIHKWLLLILLQLKVLRLKRLTVRLHPKVILSQRFLRALWGLEFLNKGRARRRYFENDLDRFSFAPAL